MTAGERVREAPSCTACSPAAVPGTPFVTTAHFLIVLLRGIGHNPTRNGPLPVHAQQHRRPACRRGLKARDEPRGAVGSQPRRDSGRHKFPLSPRSWMC